MNKKTLKILMIFTSLLSVNGLSSCSSSVDIKERTLRFLSLIVPQINKYAYTPEDFQTQMNVADETDEKGNYHLKFVTEDSYTAYYSFAEETPVKVLFETESSSSSLSLYYAYEMGGETALYLLQFGKNESFSGSVTYEEESFSIRGKMDFKNNDVYYTKGNTTYQYDIKDSLISSYSVYEETDGEKVLTERFSFSSGNKTIKEEIYASSEIEKEIILTRKFALDGTLKNEKNTSYIFSEGTKKEESSSEFTFDNKGRRLTFTQSEYKSEYTYGKYEQRDVFFLKGEERKVNSFAESRNEEGAVKSYVMTYFSSEGMVIDQFSYSFEYDEKWNVLSVNED